MRISDWISDVCSSDRRPDAEFEHVEATLNLALRVGERLAVLPAAGLGQRVHVRDDQLAHLEQHRRALRRRRIGPSSAERRVGKGGGSTGKSRWSPYILKKNKKIIIYIK